MRFFLFLVFLLSSSVFAEEASRSKQPQLEVALVSEYSQVSPGQELYGGIYFLLKEGWHVYWRNPGDSGMPPEVDWKSNFSISVGALLWPYPQAISVGPLMNYGYEKQVVLPFPVKVSEEAKGFLTLKAHIKWLVCKVDCIPGSADLQLTLPVGKKAKLDRTWVRPIRNSLAKIPTPQKAWKPQATSQSNEILLELNIPDLYLNQIQNISIFPYDEDILVHASAQKWEKSGNKFQVTLNKSPRWKVSEFMFQGVGVVTPLAGSELKEISFEFSIPVEEQDSLLFILFAALIGGILLNLMPCVFPVLSIKILSFLELNRRQAVSVKAQGWSYTVGVLVSFLALGIIVLLMQQLGNQVGWGFQLQSPGFVIGMGVLFFVLGLNLLGVFELGSTLSSVGSKKKIYPPQSEAFLSGVLAVMVATPCTAPFMGVAVGYALTRPAFASVLIFLLIGLGMALPVILLSHAPRFLKRLPKPGTWMTTFKQFLAFPLFATVIWLAWVLGAQAGIESVVNLLIGLFLVGMACWIYGQVAVRSKRKGLLWALAGALFTVGLLLPITETRKPHSAQLAHDRQGNWIPFSRDRLEDFRSQGKRVFIDFTAKWCVTCQVNKRLVLDHRSIKKAFQEQKVVLMRADWTEGDPEITEVLREFGRSGVPLYVLYVEGQDQPKILPELLTVPIVLEALKK